MFGPSPDIHTHSLNPVPAISCNFYNIVTINTGKDHILEIIQVYGTISSCTKKLSFPELKYTKRQIIKHKQATHWQEFQQVNFFTSITNLQGPALHKVSNYAHEAVYQLRLLDFSLICLHHMNIITKS
jgi:hypothetical protein